MKRQIYLIGALLIAALILPGCAAQNRSSTATVANGQAARSETASPAASFAQVSRRITPAAAKICAQQGARTSCRFQVELDDRAELPPGALVAESNRGALIVVSAAMLEQTRNADEMAFLIAHMAGHHIEGHREGDNHMAIAQAVISGAQGMLAGSVASVVNTAIRLNEAGKIRGFDSNEEIEADVLATRILIAAGYNPVRGAAIFQRSPKAMDGFLALHPPSSARRATVKQVAAALE